MSRASYAIALAVLAAVGLGVVAHVDEIKQPPSGLWSRGT
jgi:hypothetical protein